MSSVIGWWQSFTFSAKKDVLLAEVAAIQAFALVLPFVVTSGSVHVAAFSAARKSENYPCELMTCPWM
jgi:hypothetical protein